MAGHPGATNLGWPAIASQRATRTHDGAPPCWRGPVVASRQRFLYASTTSTGIRPRSEIL